MGLTKVRQGEIVDHYICHYHYYGTRSRITPKAHPSIGENLTGYYTDPRNSNEIVDIYSIQNPVAISRGGLYFKGRIDQIRMINGQAQVWDIKYSDLEPERLVNYYLPQLLLYADALQCYVGGIINVKNYTRDLPVFHHISVSEPLHHYTNYIAERLIYGC